jgi:hypothetical protein
LSPEQKEYLAELYAARIALLKGRVKSYNIGRRALTYIDLSWVDEQIDKLEGSNTPKFRRVRVVGMP